jgi:hypothetical protein
LCPLADRTITEHRNGNAGHVQGRQVINPDPVGIPSSMSCLINPICLGQMMCSTQWKPMWLVVVSIVRGLRAAGW